jgi:hypothetical protein
MEVVELKMRFLRARRSDILNPAIGYTCTTMRWLQCLCSGVYVLDSLWTVYSSSLHILLEPSHPPLIWKNSWVMSHEWKMLGVEWERNISKDMWGSMYQINLFNTLLIRLKHIYNFWFSMLVYTPFVLCFVTLHGIFMYFPELTY